jgi:hypothetical protein
MGHGNGSHGIGILGILVGSWLIMVDAISFLTQNYDSRFSVVLIFSNRALKRIEDVGHGSLDSSNPQQFTKTALIVLD